MTLIQYAARYHTDMKGLSRAWGIRHQSLRRYVAYLRGIRGRDSCARCPTIEIQEEIERLTKGLITKADWPAKETA